jgi:uncharacterized protein (DUF2345 family)
MSTFQSNIITETRSNKIKSDVKAPDFGSLNPKAITSVSALKDTNGAMAGIVIDPSSGGTGSQALIIQRARKELIAQGDSSRELKAGSHLEKVAKIYTLEADDEIHLQSSKGKIVIDAQQISLFCGSGNDFIDISPGHITIKSSRVDINPESGSHAQGTPAVPVPPNGAG